MAWWNQKIWKKKEREQNFKEKDLVKQIQNILGESQYQLTKILESFNSSFIKNEKDKGLHFQQPKSEEHLEKMRHYLKDISKQLNN